MRTKKLGATDLELSTLGLGTMAMGGSGWQYSWGPQDTQDSIATIKRAFELGINWIDTAPVYGFGHSEEVVGMAIHDLAIKPIIATKCGRFGDEHGRLISRIKRESIRAEVEASLKRLNVDVVDLYQIHWPKPEEDIVEAWETVTDLIKEGKIRYGGVSNFNIEQLERISPIHPISSLQAPYSMIERGIETELLVYCKTNGIGVIVYSPLQKGLLTGKFTEQRVNDLPVDDHRRLDLHFQGPQLSANLELAESLRSFAQTHDKTLAQLAISWVLRRPEVTATIVGARRPAQVDEIVPAGEWVFSSEDIATIDRMLEAKKAMKNVKLPN